MSLKQQSSVGVGSVLPVTKKSRQKVILNTTGIHDDEFRVLRSAGGFVVASSLALTVLEMSMYAVKRIRRLEAAICLNVFVVFFM